MKAMIPIFMIITSMALTALATGPEECNLRNLVTNKRCFGIVGQPLVFNLPRLRDTEMKLTKDEKDLIFKIGINGATVIDNSGIEKFTRKQATKTDSGKYRLEIFRKSGSLLHKMDVHVEVQAPVSKPVMSQTCSSPEEAEVTCSAEGDGLQFALTLDQDLLTQSRALDRSRLNCALPLQTPPSCIWRVNISLSRSLRCYVWNSFSNEETVIQLKDCPDFPLYLWFIVAIVPTSLAAAVFLGRKFRHKYRSKRITSIDVAYSDVLVVRPNRSSDGEIIYADVVLLRQNKATGSDAARSDFVVRGTSNVIYSEVVVVRPDYCNRCQNVRPFPLTCPHGTQHFLCGENITPNSFLYSKSQQ